MRKEYIQNLLKHLNFESIIVKYDYFIEGELDYVLCDIKQYPGDYHSYNIIPLEDGRIVTNLPDREYIVVWSLKDNQPDVILRSDKSYTPEFNVLKNTKVFKCSPLGDIHFWDIKNNKYWIININDNVKTFSISMDNRIIILLDDNTIKIWNPETGNMDLTIKDDTETHIIVTTKTKIISATFNQIKIQDINTGKLEATFDNDIYIINEIKVISEELIAILSGNTLLKLWNINTYECEAKLKHNNSSIPCFLILPDKRIANAYYDKTVIIWKDYNIQFILQHDSEITLLNVTIDNKLISATKSKNIRIWNLDTGECEVIFPILHEMIITSIVTTTDGKIISGARDGKIIVWK